LSLGSKIGRHFSIVSMLPALFLTLWGAVLVESDAWRARPSLSLLGERLGRWSLNGVAWLLIVTLVIALFLHPLQFAMTQLLEGYWGSSALARFAMQHRIVHHRRRKSKFGERADAFEELRIKEVDRILATNFQHQNEQGAVDEKDDPAGWNEDERDNRHRHVLAGMQGDPLTSYYAAEAEAAKVQDRYPPADRIMPTRLGNILRRAEDKAGKQYGLDAILTAPHLTLVAAERHVQYLRDSRQQLDTSIRLCVVSLIATALSVASLLTDGLWLLATLGPYGLAYLAYRASVAAATEYTTAVKTVIDLDRFTLYESLRIEQPRDTAEERRVNKSLMELLEGSETANVRYKKPPGPKVTGGTP
jgi:hypothetical protein